MKPITERSAGMLVFRQEPLGVHWLVLQKHNGRWEFPKGKIHPRETPIDAALRETREETGLQDLHPVSGFAHWIHYTYRRRNGTSPVVRTVHKSVVFFLAETHERTLRVSREHRTARWMTPEAVRASLSYENLLTLFQQALTFLAEIRYGGTACPHRPSG